MLDGISIKGIKTTIGLLFQAPCVELTAGAFLAGKIHIGMQNYAGDPAAVALSARLRELKLPISRLKTGMPPRIDGRSIDFANLLEQQGDTPEPVFSFRAKAEQHPQQLSCWITHTNPNTHQIIRG